LLVDFFRAGGVIDAREDPQVRGFQRRLQAVSRFLDAMRAFDF